MKNNLQKGEPSVASTIGLQDGSRVSDNGVSDIISKLRSEGLEDVSEDTALKLLNLAKKEENTFEGIILPDGNILIKNNKSPR